MLTQKLGRVAGLLSTYRFTDLISQGIEKTIAERRRYGGLTFSGMEKIDESPMEAVNLKLKSPIHLCYVLHKPLSNGGGTERFTFQLAKKMAAKGNRVTVISHAEGRRGAFAGCEGNLLWRERKEGSIRLVEYRHRKPPRGMISDVLYDDADIAAFGKRLFRDGKPDFVHLTHLRAGAAIAKACKEMEIPYGVTLTDFFCLCRYSTLIDRQGCYCEKRDCIRRCAQKREEYEARIAASEQVLKHAAFLAAPSGFVASRIRKEYGETCYVIAHDVEAARSVGRTHSHEPIRLIYAGKLAPLKGLHLLLPAMIRVKSPFTLKIYGKGSKAYEKKLRHIVGKDQRICFAGEAAHDDLSREYAEADAVIAPSLCPETYHLVAHEAIASGCAVIATPNGALCEAVQESGGAFIEAFTPEQIEHCLQAVRENTRRKVAEAKNPSEASLYEALYARSLQ